MRTRRNSLKRFSVLAALTLLVLFARKLAPQVGQLAPQVTSAYNTFRMTDSKEFTVVTEEDRITRATGGEQSIAFRRTRAQRKDGTTVEDMEMHPTGKETPVFHRRIIMYPDGSEVDVSEDTGLKTSRSAKYGPAFYWATRVGPESDCTSRKITFLVDGKKEAMYKIVGRDIVQSIPVVRVSLGDPGMVPSIYELAPSFNCVALAAEFDVEGEPETVVRDKLISATEGTPDVALFNVSGFKEVAPTEFR